MLVVNTNNRSKKYIIGKGLCSCKNKKYVYGKGFLDLAKTIFSVAAPIGSIGKNIYDMAKTEKEPEKPPNLLELINEISGKGFNVV